MPNRIGELVASEMNKNFFRFVVFLTNDGYSKEFPRTHKDFETLINLNLDDELEVDLTNCLVEMGADRDMVTTEFKKKQYKISSKNFNGAKRIITYKLTAIYENSIP